MKENVVKSRERRYWGRVKVPNEKEITCKISEPQELADDTEFLVKDINMDGIAFFANKKIKKTILKLQIKFPFVSFKEASTVWARVAYCNKLSDFSEYQVGVCYVRPPINTVKE